MNSLRRAVDYCERHKDYLFAVLFLDLDRFKVINDSLGHILGDQFLITIARRLKNCLRPTDVVARFGGDEFAVLLKEINDVSDAVNVAKRIQAQLISPINLGIQDVSTTVSIGIALNIPSYNNPENILRDADIALYRAKAQGRASYELFDADMHALAVARLQLENDLRRAIERQELQVHYQPIVSIETGKITEFEALVRWQHPLRGLISPVEFIPVAEETGLIVPLGRWVLYTACQQLHAWQMKFSRKLPLTVSVNLSAKQFTQPDLIEQIDQILQEASLDARSLSLEITETLVMENSDTTTDTLLQLRKLGIHLCIDDFGTGYSSLGRLHNLPISVLKIDRSFVSNIGIKQGNSEIVEAIVTLAHKLGMEVTAEGIETTEQFAYLRNLRCSYGQGYFFSQPLDNAAAELLIASNPQW